MVIKHKLKSILNLLGEYLARRVATNLSRKYIYMGENRLYVEMQSGNFLYVDTRDHSLLPGLIRSGRWEPWIEQLNRQYVKPGDTVIDIGCCFGFHTSTYSQLATNSGKVFGFEANPFTFKLLKDTIYDNGFSQNTHLFNAAVFNEDNTDITMNFCLGMVGGGSICGDSQSTIKTPYGCVLEKNQKLNWFHGDSWSGYDRAIVKTCSIDKVMRDEGVEVVDFIHMDIESAEPYAILGAKNIIKNSKNLKLIIEWSPLNNKSSEGIFREAIDFLLQEKFKFYKIIQSEECIHRLPDLEKIQPEDLLNLTHCDLFISR